MSDDHAMTRGELAARIGVSPNWITRNVPAALFVGNRIHWHEYLNWRRERATATGASGPEAGFHWPVNAHKFDELLSSNGRKAASHAPVESPSHGNE